MRRSASIEVFAPAVIDSSFKAKVFTLLRSFFPEQTMTTPELTNSKCPEMVVSRVNDNLLDVVQPKSQRGKVVFFDEQRLYLGRIVFESVGSKRLRSKVSQLADDIEENIERTFPDQDYRNFVFNNLSTCDVVSRSDPNEIKSILTLEATNAKDEGLPDLAFLLNSALENRTSPMYETRHMTRGLSYASPLAIVPSEIKDHNDFNSFLENVREILPVIGSVALGNFGDNHYPIVESRSS